MKPRKERHSFQLTLGGQRSQGDYEILMDPAVPVSPAFATAGPRLTDPGSHGSGKPDPEWLVAGVLAVALVVSTACTSGLLDRERVFETFQAAGIQIESVEESQTYEHVRVSDAMLVQTDLGPIEVVIFPRNIEGQVQVLAHPSRREARYEFRASVISSVRWDTDGGLYYETHRNVLMLAATREANETLAELFGVE